MKENLPICDQSQCKSWVPSLSRLSRGRFIDARKPQLLPIRVQTRLPEQMEDRPFRWCGNPGLHPGRETEVGRWWLEWNLNTMKKRKQTIERKPSKKRIVYLSDFSLRRKEIPTVRTAGRTYVLNDMFQGRSLKDNLKTHWFIFLMYFQPEYSIGRLPRDLPLLPNLWVEVLFFEKSLSLFIVKGHRGKGEKHHHFTS